MFLTRLSLAIQVSSEENNNQFSNLQKYTSMKEEDKNSDNKEGEDMMRTSMIKILRNREVLIVLDNCEDPLEDD